MTARWTRTRVTKTSPPRMAWARYLAPATTRHASSSPLSNDCAKR